MTVTRDPMVIDTNVLIVSNGRTTHASPSCQLKCISALWDARAAKTILLDDGLLVLREYMHYCSFRGQPGVGDAFFRWLWENQAVVEVCRKVPITPIPGEPGNFVEFPKDPDLKGFDMSDRKFVAVVKASGEDSPVLNATDSDWWHFRVPLERNGVHPLFLCPEMMPGR